MKKYLNATRVSGIIVMLLSLWSIFQASSFGKTGVLGTTDIMGPRAWPMVLSLGMLLLGAVLVIFGDKTTKGGEVESTEPTEKKATIKLIVTCIAMFAYVFLFEVLGFIIVTPIFIFGLTLYFGGKPLISAIYAVSFTAALYFIFRVMLGILLPPIPFI